MIRSSSKPSYVWKDNSREPNTELSNMLKIDKIKKLTKNIPFQQDHKPSKYSHSVEKAVAPTICQWKKKENKEGK